VQLSAGQEQLLTLTRALVARPSVLLFDEATSFVDGASESALREALRTTVLARGTAVLTIAHRLATAREADRVVVIDHGRIIEDGAPADLIARGGRFAALLELEAAGWDWRGA
jgi:ATP-binding cassette subfamily B protein